MEQRRNQQSIHNARTHLLVLLVDCHWRLWLRKESLLFSKRASPTDQPTETEETLEAHSRDHSLISSDVLLLHCILFIISSLLRSLRVGKNWPIPGAGRGFSPPNCCKMHENCVNVVMVMKSVKTGGESCEKKGWKLQICSLQLPNFWTFHFRACLVS